MSSASGGLIVLNPEGIPARVGVSAASNLSPRLVDLAGRTLGIIDDGLPGSEAYLRGVGDLLRGSFPNLTVQYWRKPSLSRPAPLPMIDEVAASCDGVIVGVCG